MITKEAIQGAAERLVAMTSQHVRHWADDGFTSTAHVHAHIMWRGRESEANSYEIASLVQRGHAPVTAVIDDEHAQRWLEGFLTERRPRAVLEALPPVERYPEAHYYLHPADVAGQPHSPFDVGGMIHEGMRASAQRWLEWICDGPDEYIPGEPWDVVRDVGVHLIQRAVALSGERRGPLGDEVAYYLTRDDTGDVVAFWHSRTGEFFADELCEVLPVTVAFADGPGTRRLLGTYHPLSAYRPSFVWREDEDGKGRLVDDGEARFVEPPRIGRRLVRGGRYDDGFGESG